MRTRINGPATKRKTLLRSSRGTNYYAGRPKQEILYSQTGIQSSGLSFLLLQLCVSGVDDSDLQVKQRIAHNRTRTRTTTTIETVYWPTEVAMDDGGVNLLLAKSIWRRIN